MHSIALHFIPFLIWFYFSILLIKCMFWQENRLTDNPMLVNTWFGNTDDVWERNVRFSSSIFISLSKKRRMKKQKSKRRKERNKEIQNIKRWNAICVNVMLDEPFSMVSIKDMHYAWQRVSRTSWAMRWAREVSEMRSEWATDMINEQLTNLISSTETS